MEAGTDIDVVEHADQQLQEQAAVALKAEPLSNSNKIVARVADHYGVDPRKLLHTMRHTCFASVDVTDEQMMMLLIVCEQYGLNPFVKEVYAYISKGGGIIPVVSVDGWLRIINGHSDYDGCEFVYSDQMEVPQDGKNAHVWVECRMHRKGVKFPMVVREYLDEVYMPMTGRFPGPWQTHTKRMHRHKTLIQGGRYAFGLTGIYDQDEANRIMQADVVVHRSTTNNSADFSDIQNKLESRASNAQAGVVIDPLDATREEVARAVCGDDVADAEFTTEEPQPEPVVKETAEQATIRLMTALAESVTVGAADLVGAEIRSMKRRFPGFDNAECLQVYLDHRQNLINNAAAPQSGE